LPPIGDTALALVGVRSGLAPGSAHRRRRIEQTEARIRVA
jgi:hypothetical protein